MKCVCGARHNQHLPRVVKKTKLSLILECPRITGMVRTIWVRCGNQWKIAHTIHQFKTLPALLPPALLELGPNS